MTAPPEESGSKVQGPYLEVLRDAQGVLFEENLSNRMESGLHIILLLLTVQNRCSPL